MTRFLSAHPILMLVERRAIVRQTTSYRLGHYLVRVTDNRWATLLFSAALGSLAGLAEVVVHNSLTQNPSLQDVAVIGDGFFIGVFVFLLTEVEFSAVRERRVRLLRDLGTIAELNHHVRNALETIQYAAYAARDEKSLEMINESVERIDRILRELYPVLEKENLPARTRAS